MTLRLFLFAVVVGLATALGVLGGFAHKIESRVTLGPNRSETLSQPHQPAWHADASTWTGAKRLLNPNVIEGRSTTICTEDATLVGALNTAAQRWKDALKQSYILLAVVDDGSDGPLTPCTSSVDFDVLLRRADDSDMDCIEAPACYVYIPKKSKHRRLFSHEGSSEYSLLLWRRADASVSTMVHELGHVLGLDDYAESDKVETNNCDHFRDVAVDSLGDHFSVMTYSGDTPECRTHGVITGRDLRDFYEAYHVGPLTGVKMKGAVTVTSSKRVNATFYWGETGALELSHNAKYVLAQRKRGEGWDTVGSAEAFKKNGEPREMISIIHCDGIASQYRLVGASAFRMGLKRFVDQDSLAAPLATLVEDPPSSCGTSLESDESSTGAQVAIGDASFVVGVAAWNGKDDGDDWCTGKDNCPLVLSASVTRSYCYTGAVRPKIIFTPSGGESDSDPYIAITGGHVPPPTLKAPPPVPQCHLTEGTASFTVTARWGLKADDPSRSIVLPVRVIARPKPIGAINESGGIGVSVLTVPAHESPSGEDVLLRTTYCLAGEEVRIVNSEHAMSLWLDGDLQTGTSVVTQCPVQDASLDILSLRRDGGGREVQVPSLEQLGAPFLNSSVTCMAGGMTTAVFTISGGQPPYGVTLRGGLAEVVRSTQRDGLTTVPIECPRRSVSGQSLSVHVVDNGSRSARADTQLRVSCPGTIGMPSTPSVEPGTIKSSSVALSWTEVLCAEEYEVSYEKVGGDGQLMTKRTAHLSVPVDGLLANTAYRFVVRARVGSSWSAPSAGVSVQTAPAAPSLKVDFRSWAGDEGGSYRVDVSWPQVPGATSYSDVSDVSPGEVSPARIGASQGPNCRKGASDVEWICENLAPDQMYEIAARAVNSNGDASDPGTVAFCLGPCEVRVSEISASGVRVDWEGLFDPAYFQEVRILENGGAVANHGGRSIGITIPSSKIDKGKGLKAETTYRAEVRTWYTPKSGWGAWAGVEFTTPAAPPPEPLMLSVTPSATTCLTGGSVTVDWSVTGGSGKYEVSVDGDQQSGASAEVTCQATAGEQSVTVVAKDKEHATLTDTQTITLTVTQPTVEAPTMLRFVAEATKLTLTWEGPDDATGYGVRIDGGAEMKVSAKTKSHPFRDLTPSTKYQLEVRAYIDADYSVWSSIEETTLAPPPLVLTAKVKPTSCETGGEVTVSWTVTGGSDSYTVSVDGKKKSGASAKVTCQATAGTQSVKVKATDATYLQLTATRTLSLTVTKPAPPTTATAQIQARRLTDHRVEFRLRLADGTEETTAKRYLKLPEITAGRWYLSSAFTTSIEGVEYALGVVSARLDNTVCPAFVAVTFIPTGGERITPTQYKLPVNRAADLWGKTSEFAVPLKPASAALQLAQSDAGYRMVAAPEEAKDGPGREGGLMLGDAPDALTAAQGDKAETICTAQPTGLQIGALTSSSVRLSWQAVSGASEYDVAVDQETSQMVASTQRYHDFTGLAADTDHMLRVRARSWRGSSEWSSKAIRTTVSSVPVVTITSGASPIDEGDNASFTVATDRAATTALTVKLSVTESGAMISGAPPAEATIASGARTASVTVATEDDERDESDSVVTAKLVAGSGYRPGSPSSAAVTVSDDDGQVSALTLTISASPTGCETGGEVTVSWAVTGGSGSHVVTVDGDAQTGSSTKVTCQATAGTQTVTVQATDQTHTDLTTTETLTLTVTDPLTLTATASPTSCETGGEVTVSWTVSGGSGSHAVTVDGDAQTGSLTKVTCQATAGTQTVTVQATDQTHTDLTTTETLTLTVADPVTLTASASPTSCETGGEVTVSWTVSGGSGSHTVTVDGTARSGSSTKLTCQATAGTQTITVKATDQTHTNRSATKTLNLTVTKPAPPSTVEAKLWARRLSDNRIELDLRVARGALSALSKRFAQPPKMTDLRWKQGETLSVTIDDREYTLGRISARLQNDRCPSRVEVGFLPTSGARLLPGMRFIETNSTVNAWRSSAAFEITLAAPASDSLVDAADDQGRAGDWLDDTPDATNAGPGTDGGLMSGEARSDEQVERARSEAQANGTPVCPSAPAGLSASDVQTDRITLSWTAVLGASQYDVQRDGVGIGSATTNSIESTGLRPNRSYSFRVRTRDAWGASSWSSWSETTLPLAPAKPSGLQATETTDSITLTWSSALRATGYQVRLESGSAKSPSDPPRRHTFGGLNPDKQYRLYVRATNRGGESGWVPIVGTTKPTPVSLSASVSPTGCESGESVTVQWSVSGGSGSYRVTVGGVAKTGGSAKVICRQTAGTQTIAVVATDTKHTTLSDSESLSVTVKSPPTVTGQVAARLLSSGRVELAFRPTGGSRILPTLRFYTPDTTKLTKWTSSSDVNGPAGTEKNRLLGQITVKHIKTTSSYYVDVCFRPAGSSQRICPSKNNFYYKTATVDRWLYTGTVTFKPLRVSAISVESVQDGAADAQMQPIADGEADSVGAEGGLMSDEE